MYEGTVSLIISIDRSCSRPEAAHVTDRGSPQGCEPPTLTLSRFKDSWLTGGGEVVTLTRRQPFVPVIFLVVISVNA
jgi:hypothetical protein